MFYLYILHSRKTNNFYVGYSSNPQKRLAEHNTVDHNTFTSKGRPWDLKAVFECPSELTAIRLERFIKKQKSRKLLEMLCVTDFEPTGILAQLVRVPDFRD